LEREWTAPPTNDGRATLYLMFVSEWTRLLISVAALQEIPSLLNWDGDDSALQLIIDQSPGAFPDMYRN
jgi:hypothetical protein